MNFTKTTRKAESLIEVLAAMFVLALGGMAALSLILSAYRTAQNVENGVVGINLAREGIEAVRIIRDTNWIEHAGERREYWNCLGDNDCNPNDSKYLIQEDTSYLVDFDNNFRWKLYPYPGDKLDLDNPDNDTVNTKFELGLADFKGGSLYTYATGNIGTVKPSGFYREIRFAYEEGVGDGNDVLKVTCLVQWLDSNSALQKVELITYLTDFLGRNIN